MLDPFIEEVQGRRKRLRVYAHGDPPGIAEHLATRNVTVETKPLPAGGPDPFVTVLDDEEYAGVLTLADVERLLAPPIGEPGDLDDRSAAYGVMMDLLQEAVFTGLDRRQLLAASREIEDRALRVGTGQLRVGFQSLSAFESQVPVYRRLGTGTDLEIHVRGRPDWSPPTIENVTYHRDSGSLAPFWYLAFDGGDDVGQSCALIAREEADGYVGFWTYEPHLVGEILGTLTSAE